MEFAGQGQGLSLGGQAYIGIPLALLGAVFLSLGTQFQHRGVAKVEAAKAGARPSMLANLKALLLRPSWVFGTLMLGLAVVLQLTSLWFAPLIVVQPLGAIALVMKRRSSPMFFVIAAGTLFGFVATLAKVVIGRVQTLIESEWQFGFEEWLTVLCIIGLAASAIIGSWYVQHAHANGPPDLVVAGLTVVDPIIAVTIGVVVLGEAANAPPWAFFAFGATGAVAVFGVFLLARHHPQMNDGTFTGSQPTVPGPDDEPDPV